MKKFDFTDRELTAVKYLYNESLQAGLCLSPEKPKLCKVRSWPEEFNTTVVFIVTSWGKYTVFVFNGDICQLKTD